MLINLIIADVPEEGRETSSRPQQAWMKLALPLGSEERLDRARRGPRLTGALETVPGFVAQIGGWAEGKPVQAVFLEWWRDISGYDRFRQTHAEALPAPLPDRSAKISARLGKVIMTVNERDPAKLLLKAVFLRLTDCTLKPRCSPIFIATQLQIWNPALSSAEGMLGALISRLDKGQDHFLIASFWKDRRCHERYEQEIFPLAYEQGRGSEYLAEMLVYRVPLDKGWAVLSGE